MPESRSIMSLTDEEAKTVFALAFGYGVADRLFKFTKHETASAFHPHNITISNRYLYINIHAHGFIKAYCGNGDNLGFNAYKVLTYLTSLRVELGEAPVTPI